MARLAYVAALMLAAFVGHSAATSCTATTSSTCAATLFLTGTCTSSVCACATGYTANSFGCAESTNTPVEKPTVWIGDKNQFNGKVESTATIDLKCKSNHTVGASDYKWYKDGTVISTATSDSYTVTPSSTAEAFGCKVTVGGTDSAESDTVSIQAFTDSSNLYVSEVPVVTGVPSNITSTSTHTLLCGNQVKWSGTNTIAWESSVTAVASSTDTEISSAALAASSTVKCKVTPPSGKLAWPSAHPSAQVTAPATLSSNENIQTIKTVMSPSKPVVGGYVIIRCIIQALTLNYPTGPTYKWDEDTATIAGMYDHTLQINDLTTSYNDKAYKCGAKIGDYSTADGTGVTLTATSVLLASLAAPTVTPASPTVATGSSVTLTCNSESESPGMMYEWTVGGTVSTTETSKTITATATTTATAYSCKVKIGASGTQSAAATDVSITGVDVATVTITGPTAPIAANSATWTCSAAVLNSAATVTYVWKKGSTAITGETSATYTIASPSASSHDDSYTCEITPSGGTAVASSSKTIAVASTATAPTVTKTTPATDPQTGDSMTLTCTTDHAVASAVYEWKFTVTGGSETTLSATSQTYTVSSFGASNAGAYTCKVTVGSVASAASSATTVTHDTNLGKTCSDSNFHTECTTDYTLYTGNCVALVCECVSGKTPGPQSCTTTGGAGAIMASTGMLLMAILTSHFL